MNCVELLGLKGEIDPKKTALHILGKKPGDPKGSATYGELLNQAGRIQSSLLRANIGPGDSVLLFTQPGPELFASVIAILGLGASVLLIEPFMPIRKIEGVIKHTRPKVFLSSFLGKVWGLRVPAVRKIPNWIRISSAMHELAFDFRAVPVDPTSAGVITFTSGTTGEPKGVVRTQGALVDQNRILGQALGFADHRGADLCVFANLALANLAQGKSSVIVPARWAEKHLWQIESLPSSLTPETLSTGPAFLEKLMALSPAVPRAMKSIHVGGALTDLTTFENLFRLAPETEVIHVYGSSEAEPVATSDARKAVALSKQRGYFQTLSLGRAVPEIQTEVTAEGLWVTGAHVCQFYAGNEKENRLNKKKDETGRIWHFMGDRVKEDADGLWYAGRAFQSAADFELEQKIYAFLQSSRSFLHRDAEGRLHLVGEAVQERRKEILNQFPEIQHLKESRIFRDLRHRARIDRAKSARKAKL